MRLASLKSKSRDGILCVLNSEMTEAVKVESIALSLREAMENWSTVEPQLKKVYENLQQKKQSDTFKVKWSDFHSALPRTWLFADGSAFIHHIRLVRKARNAAPPETLMTVPLMYQAESSHFLASDESIPQVDFSHGTDFEAEVGVITDFVPMGTSPEQALTKIKLIVLINDVSLRGLIPGELAQGFGFFQSKPAKSLSPVAVTPEELGSAWRDGRVHLPIRVSLNGEKFGEPNAGEMHFHFGQLIAHAAKTRDLMPGTLIGSGTVSNENAALGSGCLAEKRTLEQLEKGQPVTPFMKVGDRIEISMQDQSGKDLFGKISQTVIKKTI